jgi:hypothetical protein
VALLHPNLLDANASAREVDADDTPLLAAVGSGDDLHQVSFANSTCHDS